MPKEKALGARKSYNSTIRKAALVIFPTLGFVIPEEQHQHGRC